jgi:hypothetical protein
MADNNILEKEIVIEDNRSVWEKKNIISEK